MLLHKQKTHSKSYKKQKFNTRSRFTKVQEASESIFTLFFSSFMLFHSSLFFKFWVSYPDTRRLNKVEVGNLKFYYFLLCAGAFATLKICIKLNSLCCNYVHFSHKSLFLSLKNIFLRLFSNNIHLSTDTKLFMAIKIKFLMIKLIANVVWKTC